MYRHIVMLWFHEPWEPVASALSEQLRTLAGRFSGLLSMELEMDALRQTDACHLCMNMLFDCEQSVRAYHGHPDRQALREAFGPHLVRTVPASYPIQAPLRRMPALFATAGPACGEYDTLVRMLENGMTGMRLSTRNMQLPAMLAFLDTLHRAAGVHGSRPEIVVDADAVTDGLPDILLQTGADSLMLPMPVTSGALQAVRGLTDPMMRLYGKIRDEDSLATLPSHVQNANALVITRNDLGRNTRRLQLPIMQRRIAQTAQAAGKPYYITSGLLYSMCDHPFPSVAEVTDIHTAVLGGASGLVLNRETSMGDYPVEAMEVLHKTAELALQP